MKPKIAIVRGKYLNKYEMQFFEPLTDYFDITAFGSLTSFHKKFSFPVVSLPSPMDIPEFPYKMSILNRLFVDAQYLYGLEHKLQGFDLVHTAETYYRYTQQSLNAKKKGYVKKVIATVLENIPHNNEGIWGRKEFKRRSREELDHIIALTHESKKTLLQEGCSDQKITVVSHFIDTKRFIPTSNIKHQQSKLTILYCGRLEVYKGVLDILECAELLAHDPDITNKLEFVFVGDGSQRHVMDRIEKQKGLQYMVKHVTASYDQMPHLYQHSDIYVAPSKSSNTWIEQYNTSLLEAQASGLPIVTTMSGGIPENVGNAALLVQPGNVMDLANAIKSFIVSPQKREKYGKKARARAVGVHDISIGSRKIADIWNMVLR